MPSKKKIDAFLKELSIQDSMNEHDEEGDFDLSFYSSYSVIKIVKINKTFYNEILKNRKISKNRFEDLFAKLSKKDTHTFIQYDLCNESMQLLLNYSDVENAFQQFFDDMFLHHLDAYKKTIDTTRKFNIDSSKNEYSLIHFTKYENATVSGNFEENFSKSLGLGFQYENFDVNFHHLKLTDGSIIYGYKPTYEKKSFDISIENCIEHTLLFLMCSDSQSELIKITKK